MGPRRTNQGGKKKTIALRGRRGLFLSSDFPPLAISPPPPPPQTCHRQKILPTYPYVRTLQKRRSLPFLSSPIQIPPSPFSLFRGPSSSFSFSSRLPIHSVPFVPPSSLSSPLFFSFRRKSQPSSTCVKKEKEEDEILFLPLLYVDRHSVRRQSLKN